MKILILGGSKSGKSDFAQEMALKLAKGGVHYYVATMENTGTEADKATVASHLRRRAGMDFVTVEQGRHILNCLERADREGTFLIDSVTTLVTNELYPPEKNYETDDAGAERCGEELLELGRSRQSVAGGYMYWYDYDQTQHVGVDKWTMLCMDVHSGEVWPLEVDTPNVSLEVFETDGHLAYSCFYSAQSVACWEVVYENDRPAALKLLDDDINN